MAVRFSARAPLKLGAGAAIVLAVAMGATGWILWQFGRIYHRAEIGTIPIADVAIVPGCHVDGDTPAPMLAARLTAALELYRAGRVQRILVTGNGRGGEARAMTHWLLARNVIASDIIADGEGTRTLESMRRAAQLFGVRSAVVCTQPLHLGRTLFLARQAGIDAVGLEADLDLGRKPRFQAVEALKGALALTEVYVLGRLRQAPEPVVAASAELE